MSDDDIRIRIDDDDAGRKVPDAEPIEEIQRRGDAARTEAARARQEAAAWRQEATASRAYEAESAVARAREAADRAQNDFKYALEGGDSEAAAAAQRRIAQAEIDIRSHSESAAYLKAQASQVRPVHSDPVEAYAANRTAPTADWIRRHPEFVTDQRKNAKLTAAHYDAVGHDLEPDSPQYFQAVEKFLGIDGKGNGSRRAASEPAVPSNYNRNNPATHINGNTVVLTESEKRTATDGTLCWNTGPNKGQPIGTAEYARRKKTMIEDPNSGYFRMDS